MHYSFKKTNRLGPAYLHARHDTFGPLQYVIRCWFPGIMLVIQVESMYVPKLVKDGQFVKRRQEALLQSIVDV